MHEGIDNTARIAITGKVQRGIEICKPCFGEFEETFVKLLACSGPSLLELLV